MQLINSPLVRNKSWANSVAEKLLALSIEEWRECSSGKNILADLEKENLQNQKAEALKAKKQGLQIGAAVKDDKKEQPKQSRQIIDDKSKEQNEKEKEKKADRKKALLERKNRKSVAAKGSPETTKPPARQTRKKTQGKEVDAVSALFLIGVEFVFIFGAIRL